MKPPVLKGPDPDRNKNMIKSLTRLPIRNKLFLSYTLLFFIVTTLSLWMLYLQLGNSLESRIRSELNQTNLLLRDMIRTSADVSIKNHLRALAESSLAVFSTLYQESMAGNRTPDEAMDAVRHLAARLKIGDTGYLYCLDSKGTIRVHPEQSLIGKNISDHSFVKKQMQLKNGYLEYAWKNPGDSVERSKALYMVYFQPWDWIVSASSYKEEFSKLVSFDDFRNEIPEFHSGAVISPFLFKTDGSAIVHPVLGDGFMDYKDADGNPIFKQMTKIKNGIIRCRWKANPTDAPREKIIAFSDVPELGWIVASSSYSDTIHAPLTQLKATVALVFILSAALTGLLTLALSRTMTRPLTDLIQRLETASPGFQNRQMESVSGDEIEKLSRGFTLFLETIKASEKTLRDEIRVRREAQSKLSLFEKVFENADEGICITETDGTITAVNPAFESITGYREEEVIGKNPKILKSDRHDTSFYEQMWNSIQSRGQWSGEIWNRRKDGEAFPELLSISAIENREGEVTHYVSVFHDISDLKRKEEQIRYMAFHDPLTDLPNRTLLRDRLRKAILRAARNSDTILVVFVDLDNFKNVNDTIGHAQGDQMLRQVADRLHSIIRTGDTISRLGGDEFIIMIPEIASEYEIARVIERVQQIFQTPFHLGESKFHITASIGFSLFPRDGDTPDDLIKNADLAMYQSKHLGKNRYHSFAPEMEARIQEKIKLDADMRQAIEADEFHVFFQPRVCNRTLECRGMEALVRWIKPDGSIVPPNVFIPLAEESGLIVPMGEIILKKAVSQAADIMSITGKTLKVSVNLSPKQFEHQGFEEMVNRTLGETGFSPERLEFEITETLLMKNLDTVMPRLRRLDDMQITMAIDDFGTGYSSLAYLKRLPISILKIDKSFIDDIVHDKESAALVKTVVLMAQTLNIALVAEGVETREQFQVLERFGNMEIQGYLFSPPVPRDRFLDFLKTDLSTVI